MRISSGARTNAAKQLWVMTNKPFSFTQTITPSEWSGSTTKGWSYSWSELTIGATSLPTVLKAIGTISNGVVSSSTVENVSTGSVISHSISFTTSALGILNLVLTLTSKTKPTRDYDVAVSGTYTDTKNVSNYRAGRYDYCRLGTRTATNAIFNPRSIYLPTKEVDIQFDWSGSTIQINAYNPYPYDIEITDFQLEVEWDGGTYQTFTIQDLSETTMYYEDWTYIGELQGPQGESESSSQGYLVWGGTNGLKEGRMPV